MQFALATARIGVFEWEPGTDRLSWSSTTTGLGLSIEQAPATGRAFLEIVHPDDRGDLLESRERAIREGIDAETEFRIVAPDGVVHWVHAHGRTVFDADGKPLRVIGVNADVTPRKSLEEQLRTAQVQVARMKVLRATMRTVQDIVSNALTSLQMFRFIAEQHVSPASLQQFDQIITDTAARLKALGDLNEVVETEMVMGPGIVYDSASRDRT